MLSIFSCAHQLSDTFFVKVSIQVLCPFFNQVVWVGYFFFMSSCMSSLFILDINPLSYTSFANIFCHSVGSLFNLLIVFFAVQKHDVVLFLYFCFFLPSLKTYAPQNIRPVLKSVLPMFSSRNFRDSGLIFTSNSLIFYLGRILTVTINFWTNSRN